MKLAISGGHITPAYALMQFCQEKGDQVILFGRSESKLERNIAHELSAQFIPAHSPKLNRVALGSSLVKLPRLLSVSWRIRKILKHKKIEAVVGFGGYLSLPLVFAAWSLRLPIIIHEQTMRAGLASKLASFFSLKICISYPQSQKNFPDSKVVLTGNLIRKVIWQQDLAAPKWFRKLAKKPILLITGGNQGSEVINKTIISLLPELTKTFTVIHQTGRQMNHLPENSQDYYHCAWFSATEISWLMHHATLMVGRAGANTLSELMVTGLPAVLIPFPYTQKQEQEHNAQFMREHNAAIVLDQSRLNQETLSGAIEQLYSQLEIYRKSAKKMIRFQKQDAVEQLYSLLTSFQHVS